MTSTVMPDAGEMIDKAEQEFEAFFALSAEEDALLEQMMRDVDVSRVGKWYGFPSPLWEPPRVHYFRCGRASSPRAQALSQAMKMLRWKPAPEGVRCGGFEADFLGGGRGEYICIRDEDFGKFQEWRAARARKKAGNRVKDGRKLLIDAVGAAGAYVEDLDVKPTKSQAVLDARAELADKRAKKARDRAIR